MMLKAAICDDDKNDVGLISKYLQKYEMENDIDFNIYCYTKSSDLLENYTSKGCYDILFLDVEMPGLSGLELARKIRELPDYQVKIIFVSNYPKYMQDSFNVQAFHYLDKPLSYAGFCELMNRILEDYKRDDTIKLLISNDLTEELIHIEDIVYIETERLKRGYLTFVLKDRKLTIRGKLTDWEKELAPYSFIMSFKGILVNLSHVHYIEKNTLVLLDKSTIPLSRRYEQEFKKAFTSHVIKIHQRR